MPLIDFITDQPFLDLDLLLRLEDFQRIALEGGQRFSLKLDAAISHGGGFDFLLIGRECIETKVYGAQSHGLFRSVDRLSRPKQYLLFFAPLSLTSLPPSLDLHTLRRPILPNLN